ncbi:MAG: PolC-type DNA polymerase III [Clostridia bacterium]|nr:PolC-type DNA polymerase III [Clostridia bacterium]
MATSIPLNQVFPKVDFDSDKVNGIVTDMAVDKLTRSFVISVTFKSVVSSKAIEHCCNEIRKCYKAEHVKIIPTYEIDNPSEADILKVVSNCVHSIGEETPFYKAIFDSCEYKYEDNVVKIILRHMNVDYLESDNVHTKIAREVSRALNTNIQIHFIDEPMNIEVSLEPIYDVPETRKKQVVELTEDEPILGKKFEVKEITPLGKTDEGSGEVVVKGNTFALSSRYLEKSDKYIISFYLTDNSGSVAVKFFTAADNAEAIINALKNTKTIVVKGKCELDSYTSELTVNARSILRNEDEELTGEPDTKMCDITEETGFCVTHGSVHFIDVKEIPKAQRAIITFYMNDPSGSAAYRFSVPMAESDNMKGFIKKAGALLVRGIVTKDRFTQEITVSVRSMEKRPVHVRGDDAPVKRVELHAHSKSSAMDAVVTAKDLVNRAIHWGHKAVALTDHGCVQAFPEAMHAKEGAKSDIKVIYGVEGYLIDKPEGYNSRDTKRYHIIILAQNLTGLKNLYKLISISNLDYFYKRPLMPRIEIEKHREGLIIGSACEAGEVFRTMMKGVSDEELEAVASFYDYLEIQPIGNNEYMIRNGTVPDREALMDFNRKIIALGERMNKKVVATCDVHFLDAKDEIYRRILQAGQGYQDADFQAPLYFRNTEEMLSEFQYLGEEKAYEVVVTNTNIIADMIEDFRPIPHGQFSPKIEGSEDDIRNISRANAERLYGTPLPQIVEDRLNAEIESVVDHGYADLYNIARLLVEHSIEDGYIVGSRGSVGSSFLAYLSNITEVNSLCAHYRCTNCKHSEFFTHGEYDSGFDMPDKICPVCGTPLTKDGHDIPFETFLGYGGGKQPDIDLNFSGEYQPKAHKYTEEIFGEGYTFRAGTVSTVADKTAFGYVMKYCEERGLHYNQAEIERLKLGCMDVKRTTGQHPGGIIVLPKGHDIHEFTPVQHPADDTETDIITTHFDYHSIDENLLKLDILGHDDPTMIRMLEDLTGVNAREIPLDDQKIMSLFLSPEALGVTKEDIGSETGTFAVPEFGTHFVRQMLMDTQPKTFSDLVRISGLSHGTNVWTNNAQDLVKAGICTLSKCICCRDDIMIYLIHMGIDPGHAFKIMEKVRKGKKLQPEDEVEMRAAGVPEWYIESCNKIQYMFPKAHAAAYVTMSFRVAYFKLYYPIAFYQSYYTVRADTFDYEMMALGRQKVQNTMQELSRTEKPTAKDKVTMTILEVVNEMYARGIEFTPLNVFDAHPTKFLNIDGKIMPALNSIAGLGTAAAESVMKAREEAPFKSIDDFKSRTSVSQTHIETLKRLGAFGDLPESSQVTIFELGF